MDLDTLIYIIVMIVFVVLGSLGKKKKPVQQATNQDEPEDEALYNPEAIIAKKLRSFIEGYEEQSPPPSEPRTVYHEEPEVRVQPAYVAPASFEPANNKFSFIDTTDEIIDEIKFSGGIIEEGVAAFEHFDIGNDNALSEGDLTMQEDPHLNDSKLSELFSEFKQGLDLRKAIIYSEIINRKQF